VIPLFYSNFYRKYISRRSSKNLKWIVQK